ncbi:hypothetical protein G7046_g9875 [Stylonectria norvegica]|nr:hypothetical protein G7046_g9875 [Stylonectria norvegica]
MIPIDSLACFSSPEAARIFLDKERRVDPLPAQFMLAAHGEPGLDAAAILACCSKLCAVLAHPYVEAEAVKTRSSMAFESMPVWPGKSASWLHNTVPSLRNLVTAGSEAVIVVGVAGFPWGALWSLDTGGLVASMRRGEEIVAFLLVGGAVRPAAGSLMHVNAVIEAKHIVFASSGTAVFLDGNGHISSRPGRGDHVLHDSCREARYSVVVAILEVALSGKAEQASSHTESESSGCGNVTKASILKLLYLTVGSSWSMSVVFIAVPLLPSATLVPFPGA